MALTNLDEANQLILGKIGSQSESLILGFLPLSIAEEEAVLRLVRDAFRRPFASVHTLLKTAPAAVVYALAVAPGRTLTTGGQFWPALKTDLGLDLGPQDRPGFSMAFRRVCRSLGLINGTIEDAGWVHAAPFIFQAGILHYWKDALASALRCTLAHIPPPDVEDPSAILNFREQIVCHVHNQPTLKLLLATQVGPLLIKRLVQAYSRQDWQVLPPHLQEPMRQAFAETGRGAVLKSPYLGFNLGYHQLEVVLPAVPGKFASAETHWLVNGRQYPARQQWDILCSECPSADVEIELRQLHGQYRPQVYSVACAIGASVPFRLFKKDTGRERRVPLSAVIDLAPGTYLLVMASDVVTNDEDYVAAAGAFRRLEFELRPGGDPVVLKRGRECWTLRPELQPGIYIDRERAKVAVLDTGEYLHYGEDLGVVAFFPTDDGEPSETQLLISCKEQKLSQLHRYSGNPNGHGGYRFETELNVAIRGALTALPPGVHRLNLSLAKATARIDHSVWYWRGLNLITTVGFDCAPLPRNLQLQRCRGLLERDGKLVYPDNFHGASIQVSISSPEAVLSIPRAGVQVSIRDSGAEWDDDMNPSAPTVVQPNDKRLLKFTSGGYQSWKIASGDRVVAVLDAKRPYYVTTLAGLATEVGGSGRIQAKSEDGITVPLVSIVRPLSSDLPRCCLDHQEIAEVWRFAIQLPLACEIGLRVNELSVAPDALDAPITTIAAREDGRLSFQDFVLTDGANGERILLVNVKAKGDAADSGEQLVRVKVTIQINALRNRLWVLDFFRRSSSGDSWIPIECAERVGYSAVRIFAWGEHPPAPDSGWWPRLRRAEWDENSPTFIEAIRTMSAEDLRRGLQFCRSFLSWKYPSTVWVLQAKRLQAMPPHLGRIRFSLQDSSAAVWWDEAATELANFAASTANPVVRRFLLATQLDSLRTPRSVMLPKTDGHGITPLARSMAIPSAIQAAGSIRGYLLPASAGGDVAGDILFCYKNFQRVSAGSEDFRDLQLNSFLAGDVGVPGLSESTERLDETAPRFEVKRLLGPEHLLASIRALNRRCRPLFQASNGGADQSLTILAQALEAMSQRVDHVAPVIARRVGWDVGAAGGKCYWTPPLLENAQATKAAALIWCVTALARLTANGRFSAQEFQTHIQSLLTTGDCAEVNAARLLSLGAELFAFYVALFELSAPSTR